MAKRKTKKVDKRSRRVIKHLVPPEIAEGINGEQAYVVFFTRVRGYQRQTVVRTQQVLSRMAAITRRQMALAEKLDSFKTQRLAELRKEHADLEDDEFEKLFVVQADNEAIQKFEAEFGDQVNDLTESFNLASLEASEIDRKMHEVYAGMILEWNLVDDETGKPLDDPHNNPNVFDLLFDDQLDWIQKHISDIMEFGATEGNV